MDFLIVGLLLVLIAYAIYQSRTKTPPAGRVDPTEPKPHDGDATGLGGRK